MARFDVLRNPRRATAGTVPYLLDVQHDLFDGLGTRLVVPLLRASSVPKPLARLNPVFQVAGESVVMMTPEMAGVPRSALGQVVGTLDAQRDAIVAAIDFLVTGV